MMKNNIHTNISFGVIAIWVLAILGANAQQPETRPKDGLKVRVVLYYPSDVEPPEEARSQLAKYSDYAQQFFSHWLNHWGYKTDGTIPFEGDSSGKLEVVFVKGKHLEGSDLYRGADGKIAKGAPERILEEIVAQSDVSGKNEVVWIFLHKILGEDAGLAIGRGSATSGGVCFVKFRPGAEFTNDTEISSPGGKNAGLRGAIHELGHAFGLPHNGSHNKDRLGSSLMGKPDRKYKRENPKDDRVYLSKASAALIWKSSVFDGSANREERARIPRAKLGACEFSYDRQADTIKVSGKISSDIRAHSVVVANQPENVKSTYFQKYFSARIKSDGTFEVTIDELEHTSGRLVVGFCFENGFVGGSRLGRRSHLTSGFFRNYHFKDGQFSFAGSWSRK